MSVHISVSTGDDGVFSINKTSGCITLLTLPIYLRREIFNIKVRVSCASLDKITFFLCVCVHVLVCACWGGERACKVLCATFLMYEKCIINKV